MEQAKMKDNSWTPEQVAAHNARIAAGKVKHGRPFVPTEYKRLAPTVTAVTVLADIAESTDESKLNKTEKAYLAYLRTLNPKFIGIQNITLKLANDCRLTPDFVTVDDGIVFTDVKGFQREDALIKMKVAARQFRWAKFVIVKKTKSGWEHTEVKP